MNKLLQGETTKELSLDCEIVFGRNPVLELIENSSVQVNKIYLSNSLKDRILRERVINFAREKKIPYYVVPTGKLNKLANGGNHQGLVLSVSPVKYLSVDEIIQSVISESLVQLVLIAHEIEDAHNLGAMIRTFVAATGSGIILTGRSNVGINATMVKTSAGTLFQAKFARQSNCVNVLNKLKENGFWIVGTDNSSASKSVYSVDFPKQLAVLVGNEHEGLGQLIKKHCDFLVKVPISDKVDSLNVSVAFGIVLFEFLRQKYLNK